MMRFFKKKMDSQWYIPLFDQADIVKNTLYGYLSHEEANILVNASDEFKKITKDPHEKSIKVNQLLQHILFHEEKQADQMLKKNPVLLLEKGEVTDYSDRTFIHCTAFELAKWLQDFRMCQMLWKHFNSLPRDEFDISKIVTKQFETLVEYRQGNSIVASDEYSPDSLIKWLNDYYDSYYSMLKNNDYTLLEYVNIALKKLPIWIIQSLNPDPQFNLKAFYTYDYFQPIKARASTYVGLHCSFSITQPLWGDERAKITSFIEAVTSKRKVAQKSLAQLKTECCPRESQLKYR